MSDATLWRFAASELAFKRGATTIPVADCAPGEEVQLDTGWMTLLDPDLASRRRRFRSWIFTPVVSRFRFVYPVFSETTTSAIEVGPVGPAGPTAPMVRSNATFCTVPAPRETFSR